MKQNCFPKVTTFPNVLGFESRFYQPSFFQKEKQQVKTNGIKTKHLLLYFSWFICISLTACKEDPEVIFPELEIKTIENITHNSAIVRTQIISNGSFDFGTFETGICYNEKGSPTINDQEIIDIYKDNYLDSTYFSPLASLKPNKKYFIRAYAKCKTPDKVVYSNEFEFITSTVDSFIDERDQQVYRTIKIGTQTWFAENLNFQTPGSFTSDPKYGRYYTVEAALNACPEGWHLPSDDDWKILEQTLGIPDEELDMFFFRGDQVVAGGRIKEPGRSNWLGNIFSTNITGFTALPAAVYLTESGTVSHYSNRAVFLSSTIDPNDSSVIVRSLASYENGIERKNMTPTNGYSVRCLRNN